LALAGRRRERLPGRSLSASTGGFGGTSGFAGESLAAKRHAESRLMEQNRRTEATARNRSAGKFKDREKIALFGDL